MSIRLLTPLLGLVALACCLPLPSGSTEQCAESKRAVDVCTLISNPNTYDGKELVIRGFYQMVIHGSTMTGSGCKTTDVNMRQAPKWKANKQAEKVLRAQTKKNQFQSVELVIRGRFRVAKQGQCFGQNCLAYEIEESELLCAAPSEAKEN